MKTNNKPLYEWTNEDVVNHVETHGRLYGNTIPVSGGNYAVPDPRSPNKNLFSNDTNELVDRIRGFVKKAKVEFANHISDGIDAAAK